MALVVLFCMVQTDHCLTWAGFAVTTMCAIAVPWLLDSTTKYGISAVTAESVMIVSSFLITCLYAFQVTGSLSFSQTALNMRNHIIIVSVLVHMASGLATALRMYIIRKRG